MKYIKKTTWDDFVAKKRKELRRKAYLDYIEWLFEKKPTFNASKKTQRNR